MRIASALLLTVGLACDAPEPAAARPDGPLDAQILEIARVYGAYGRIDDFFRWATPLCSEPAVFPPTMSRSRDAGTHGGKLYYLFARDREAYFAASSAPQPLGQALVKESWTADGGAPRAQSALFVMMKAGPGPATDEGWIYATVNPEKTRVTSSGRLASCMKCHEEAPRDRMFGLPVAKAD